MSVPEDVEEGVLIGWESKSTGFLMVKLSDLQSLKVAAAEVMGGCGSEHLGFFVARPAEIPGSMLLSVGLEVLPAGWNLVLFELFDSESELTDSVEGGLLASLRFLD